MEQAHASCQCQPLISPGATLNHSFSLHLNFVKSEQGELWCLLTSSTLKNGQEAQNKLKNLKTQIIVAAQQHGAREQVIYSILIVSYNLKQLGKH